MPVRTLLELTFAWVDSSGLCIAPPGGHKQDPNDTIRRTGALAHWRTGALAHWRTGALAHWRTGALAHWRTGALAHARCWYSQTRDSVEHQIATPVAEGEHARQPGEGEQSHLSANAAEYALLASTRRAGRYLEVTERIAAPPHGPEADKLRALEQFLVHRMVTLSPHRHAAA